MIHAVFLSILCCFVVNVVTVAVIEIVVDVGFNTVVDSIVVNATVVVVTHVIV
jgi:hypothetical protein